VIDLPDESAGTVNTDTGRWLPTFGCCSRRRRGCGCSTRVVAENVKAISLRRWPQGRDRGEKSPHSRSSCARVRSIRNRRRQVRAAGCSISSARGADMAHTFNISRAWSSLPPLPVSPWQNTHRAVTSKCGSADVLEALGARIELPPEPARRCLEECGVTFFFAPLYHPAFKNSSRRCARSSSSALFSTSLARW